MSGSADEVVPVGARKGERRGASRQAGEAVLEDDDVVVRGGHLAGQPGGPWAQRAEVGSRLVGAVLAQCGNDDPLSGLTVEAQLRLLPASIGERPSVRDGCGAVAG